MNIFLFTINAVITIFGIYSVTRNADELRERGLRAAAAIFWWGLTINGWALFIIKISFFQ